ncbi:MAG TPA: hypothetical protein VGB85_11060 [Nannocystis sp.]|jgi:hypothetical protein
MAFKVGEDIDAWCTKCRTDTLHVVVALKPGVPEPKRVECKECHGQHMYHAPKIGPAQPAATGPAVTNRTAAARTPKAPKVPVAPKVAAAAKAARALKSAAATAHTLGAREWIKRMDEFALQHDLVMRSYSMRETFSPGEPVQHPKFGKGVVVEIVDKNKVAILFEEGRKVLAMGAIPSA